MTRCSRDRCSTQVVSGPRLARLTMRRTPKASRHRQPNGTPTVPLPWVTFWVTTAAECCSVTPPAVLQIKKAQVRPYVAAGSNAGERFSRPSESATLASLQVWLTCLFSLSWT